MMIYYLYFTNKDIIFEKELMKLELHLKEIKNAPDYEAILNTI